MPICLRFVRVKINEHFSQPQAHFTMKALYRVGYDVIAKSVGLYVEWCTGELKDNLDE